MCFVPRDCRVRDKSAIPYEKSWDTKKEPFVKRVRKTVAYCDMVAGEGFEPTTFGL